MSQQYGPDVAPPTTSGPGFEPPTSASTSPGRTDAPPVANGRGAAPGRPRSWLAALAVAGFVAYSATGGLAVTTALRPGVGQASPAPTAEQTTSQKHTDQPTTGTTSGVTEAQSSGVVLITAQIPGGEAAGTGMVVDSSGLILTNYHVVQGSTAVAVTLASTRQSFKAIVVGHDATDDVALLKVPVTGLTAVKVDNDPVAVGDPVSAVGNAQGQGYLTASPGTITATSQTVTVANDTATGSETLSGVYVSDAAAQPGDSGGPLFDAQNEVAAMTTAGQQTQTVSRSRVGRTVATYAIPINKALSIVTQIEAGKETADVRVGPNPYLGISISSVAAGPGVTVVAVTPGTPAARAGMTGGSVITTVGGQKIASQSQLAAALAGHNPGDKVSVSWVDASGRPHSAQVTLAESPLN